MRSTSASSRPPDERRPETPCQRAAPLTLASPLLLLSTQEEPHMTWFRRRYGIADYGRAFEEFEALFNRLHGPRDMMMIKTRTGRRNEGLFERARSEARRSVPRI